jgi:hypothetical protein
LIIAETPMIAPDATADDRFLRSAAAAMPIRGRAPQILPRAAASYAVIPGIIGMIYAAWPPIRPHDGRPASRMGEHRTAGPNNAETPAEIHHL